jgi:hypothetical protein
MFRRLTIGTAATGASLLLLAAPAFAQDCFLTHAAATSHAGSSAQWVSFPLSAFLTAPTTEDGLGLCPAQADATVVKVAEAGLPTVFFVRSTTTLPDAGGPGKGGIDHFETTPLLGQIAAIASQVAPPVSC